jgi:hypothetical protein
MTPPSHDKERDRRGFLKNFLSDFQTHRRVAHEELRKDQTRASVLALKFAKNELELEKVGIQNPVLIENSVFSVKIQGNDKSEQRLHIELKVDCENKTVEVPKADRDSE